MRPTNRTLASALLLTIATLGCVRDLGGQTFQIGIIDFYGLRRVPTDDVRRALTFNEGATISLADGLPAYLAESERTLSTLPGVARARTSVICCDGAGRMIVFVGIQEKDQSIISFHAAPRGTVRLAADIARAGDEFQAAFFSAIARGDFAEDDSQGHALAHDAAVRAIQERFIEFAQHRQPALRRVLRESSDESHRALAAQILGYVVNKQAVVSDLVNAMVDPADNVRNNAMRALLVFEKMTPGAGGPAPRIPYQPFIALLNSPVWTDLNKAAGALAELSTGRNARLLATLRREAIDSLVEMARWKSKGHAQDAFTILGRIASLPDQTLQEAWERGDRESVIAAALNRR